MCSRWHKVPTICNHCDSVSKSLKHSTPHGKGGWIPTSKSEPSDLVEGEESCLEIRVPNTFYLKVSLHGVSLVWLLPYNRQGGRMTMTSGNFSGATQLGARPWTETWNQYSLTLPSSSQSFRMDEVGSPNDHPTVPLIWSGGLCPQKPGNLWMSLQGNFPLAWV